MVLSLIVLTGFTAGGYGVALFITLATAVIGIFVTNFIFVLPYILFFGTVSIVSCLTREKIKNKVISIIVRIVYYTAVVTLVYLFCDVISGETLKAILSKGIAYEIVFCLLGIILLYIYELCLNYVNPMIADRIKRITKK